MGRMFAAFKPKINKLRTNLYLLRRNKLTFISLLFILLLVLVAIFAPLIVPYPEHVKNMTNASAKLIGPCKEYWFGTDELGRDIFSRILYGTRISLVASVGAVGLAMLIGIPLGAVAGARGGLIDDIIMRICDIFLSFPSLLLAIVIAAFAAEPAKRRCV